MWKLVPILASIEAGKLHTCFNGLSGMLSQYVTLLVF